MKRVLAYAAIIAGLAMTGSSAVGHYAVEPVYNVYYYSDQAKQNQVGFAGGTCNWGTGAGSELQWGDYGPYSDQELIAYCDNGVWIPL